MSDLTELGKALLELNEERVNLLVQQKAKAGEDPMAIIRECNDAMVEVGNLFEKDIYYISELMMSGELFSGIMEQLKPKLKEVEQGPSKGLVVIGAVKNDIHDIGKNIVTTLLRASGFEVVDLGVDVPAEVFVQTVKERKPKVVGLSALLNSTFSEMKKVVDELKSAGLRDQVKVIIGGSPCDEEVRRFAGADFYAKDAGAGVRLCTKIYE